MRNSKCTTRTLTRKQRSAYARGVYGRDTHVTLAPACVREDVYADTAREVRMRVAEREDAYIPISRTGTYSPTLGYAPPPRVSKGGVRANTL